MSNSLPLLLQQPSIATLLFLPLLFILLFLIKRLLFTPLPNKNSPPSPPQLPLIGNFHQLGTLPHHSLNSLSHRHGPLMLLHLGNKPTAVASSAAAAKEIMKTHDLNFSNRPQTKISRRLLYDNKDISIAPYGEYWRQLKSICVLHLLSNKKVNSFRRVREEETKIMMEKIRGERELINLSGLFLGFMNDFVCRVAFGRKYESGEEIRELLKELLVLLGEFSFGGFFPWFGWVVDRVSGLEGRVERVANGIDEFLEGVVEERMKDDDDEQQGEDFAGILIKIQRDDAAGVSIDRDSIKAILLDIYSAGTDTTSAVLEWAMTELFRHPTIMTKLQSEVRQVLNGKQDITEDDLTKMQYLKAVIKETLRIHPPIPLLVPREASQDVKVMGYNIAAGTMVITNAWAIGRDPASWDEPEEFRPERFLNSIIDFKGHDYELIPFGAGRRGCPGIAFAMATNEFVLANLMGKFDWELPDGAKGEDLNVEESPGVTIHKKVPLIAIATACS
ncbi:hypothetical protein LguiB_022709 [Lonicera macranthoides]